MKYTTIQAHPAFGGENRYQAKFEVLDIRKQITVLIDVFGKQHMERDKRVSNATQKKRIDMLHHFIDQLKDRGFHLKRITNLDSRHLRAIISGWKDAALSASTTSTYLSLMRWLVQCIGKAGMVMAPSVYGLTMDDTARTYVASRDKSWSGNGIDRPEIIAAVRNEDLYPAMYLELMDRFGLRLQEAIMIRPAIAWVGDSLNIVDGTKGGRPRVVPVRTQQQRDVLSRAIALASSTFQRSLVPEGKNLKQALQRAYYIFKKVGITKATMNITPHGLRHGYANDRYEEESGMPSTVRGGHGENYDRPKDLSARKIVSEELGHSRINITAAYTGARKRGRPPLKN